MMVLPVTMPEGIGPYHKGKEDHARLKINIMNDVDSEKGKAGKEKWQHGTVNGAGQRGPDSQCIPVYPCAHEERRYQ